MLFAMAYFTNGGFTHTEAYNLPIYLRTFYLKQLEEIKERESDATKPKGKGSKPISKK